MYSQPASLPLFQPHQNIQPHHSPLSLYDVWERHFFGEYFRLIPHSSSCRSSSTSTHRVSGLRPLAADVSAKALTRAMGLTPSNLVLTIYRQKSEGD